MRAIVCSEFAPLDALRVVESPTPEPGPDQVRIAVTAAGVNFVDALFVQGKYQIKPPLPFVPGNEVAGVIDAVGGGVDAPAIGARVFANVGLGGYASHVVIDARRVMHTPDSLTDGQAATFTQSYMTAWFALRERARAQAGQRLLVLGAGGGVGLAAVDVGAALGLHVLAAASSPEKRALAADRGAEQVVDSSSEDVKERAKEWSGGGVDLVYDPVGGPQGEAALRALADDGQFLVIGFASGAIPQLPANQVLLRNRRVTGVDWGGWVGKGHAAANQQMLQAVLAEITAGRLRPVEPTSYAFDDVARALEDQVERRVAGKTALVP
jgi:NADPH2:quinone reductase